MTVSKEQLTKAARKDIRAELGWDSAQEWKYREQRDPYTPEELARVAALQAQWEALGQQGKDEGWLEWSGGYDDGSWQVAHNDFHPTRKIQVKETKATRARRIARLHEEVEAKVAKLVEKQWKAIQDAEAIIARLGK